MEIWTVRKPLCWLWLPPHPFLAFSTLPSAPGGWSCGWSLLAGSNWAWPLWATEGTIGRGRTRWASCLSRLALGHPQLKLLLGGPSSEVPVHTGLWEHSGPSGEPTVPSFSLNWAHTLLCGPLLWWWVSCCLLPAPCSLSLRRVPVDAPNTTTRWAGQVRVFPVHWGHRKPGRC